jgi:hypothetical protein
MLGHSLACSGENVDRLFSNLRHPPSVRCSRDNSLLPRASFVDCGSGFRRLVVLGSIVIEPRALSKMGRVHHLEVVRREGSRCAKVRKAKYRYRFVRNRPERRGPRKAERLG